MRLKYTIIFFLLAIIAGAQNVSFRANTSSTAVFEGEQFQVSYSVNAKGSSFRAPDFNPFSRISGPMQGSSSNIQIINGKTTQSVTYTYTYYLRAPKSGNYTINPAKITVKGKEYTSNSLKIQVAKQKQSSGNQGGNNTSQTAEISSNDLFVKTIVNKRKAYLGEEIILIHKIYTNLNRVDLEGIKPPSYNGFWKEEIDYQGNIQTKTEIVNGVRYQTAELGRTVLFPQQTGRLTIGKLETKCLVEVIRERKARNQIEYMMYGPVVRYRDVQRKTIYAPAMNIDVTALPAQGKPANFSGAVGTFDFGAEISKTDAKTGEAIDLSVILSGSGNLNLIDNVELSFPPDFEIYDPKIIDNINVTGSGVSGKRTLEYLIIPQREGVFEIESVEFVYFDPSKKQYITHRSPSFKLKITKGKEGANASLTTAVNQEDIQYIGSDVRHIKTGNYRLKKIGSVFFGSLPHYLLYLIPVIIFLLGIIILRNEIRKRRNIALMRNRKANKIASKRLKTAAAHMKQNKEEAFYESVSQALWGFVGDKCNIPQSNWSLERIQKNLDERDIPESIIDDFTSLIEHCEYARFAPVLEDSGLEGTYSKAEKIILDLHKFLK